MNTFAKISAHALIFVALTACLHQFLLYNAPAGWLFSAAFSGIGCALIFIIVGAACNTGGSASSEEFDHEL